MGKFHNLFFIILFSIIFTNCKQGELYPSLKVSKINPPTVTSVRVEINKLIIEGSNLENAIALKIKGPTIKEFSIESKKSNQLVGKNINEIPIHANHLIDLVISTAQGDTLIPVTFTPGPESIFTASIADEVITTDKIDDDAISTEKVQDGSITRSKLGAGPGDNPIDGDVFMWNNGQFELVNVSNGKRALGDGTVTEIYLGKGIVDDNSPITDTGLVEVNTGVTGDPDKTKIPYFNSNNELVLDSTTQETKLFFKEASSTSYSISNDGSLRVKNENNSTDLLTIEGDGNTTFAGDLIVAGENLTVDGTAVCLENGDNCPEVVGVKSITTDDTLNSTGTEDILLSVNAGTGTEQIVRLDSSSRLPAVDGSQLTNLPGSSITNIIAGTSLIGGGSSGDVTLDVIFGAPGLAQEWKPRLDNLGTLNFNDNAVVIGNGYEFVVEYGITFQDSVKLLPGRDVMAYNPILDDIGSATPTNPGDYLRFDGSNWGIRNIPTCLANEVLTSVGNSFVCTRRGILGPAFSTQFRAALFSDTTGENVIESAFEFPTTAGSQFQILKQSATTALEFAWNDTLSAADGIPAAALTIDNSGNASVSGLLSANSGNVEIGHGGTNAYVNNVGSGNLEFQKSGTTFMGGTTASNSANYGSNLTQGTSTSNLGGGLNVGSWHMGAVGHSPTTYPGASHVSCSGAPGDYAILQDTSCKTMLNSRSGQYISIRIGNAEVYRIDTTFQCPSGWGRYGKVCYSGLQGAAAGSTAGWNCRSNNAHMCDTADFIEMCNYNTNILTTNIWIGDTYNDDSWKVSNSSTCGNGNFDGPPSNSGSRQYRCCK